MTDIYYWLGGTSAVWAVNANWEKEGGGVGYPVAGDDPCFIYADPTNSPVGGNLGVKFRKFLVGKNYNGGLGSYGLPLQFTAEEVILDAENAEDIYIHGGNYELPTTSHEDATTSIAATTTAAPTYIEVVRLQNSKVDAKVYLSGYFEQIYAKKGLSELSYLTRFTGSDQVLNIGYVDDPAKDVNMVIHHGAVLPASIEVTGGVITNYAETTAVAFQGGQWTHGSDTETNCGDLGTFVVRGGTLIWNKGDATKFEHHAGTIDASKGHTARTVTDVEGHDGAYLNLNNGIGNITITNPIKIQGGTYQLNVSPGTELDVNNVSDAPTTTA